MSLRVRRLAALAAVSALVAAVCSAATPALANVTIPFEHYAVSGSLTPKKLNEPVTLPKGSTFNGAADFSSLPPNPGWKATVSGHMVVPPFVAELKLEGTVPTQVHTTFTEVGTSEGTITEAPQADCANAVLPGPCATMSVKSQAIIGMTELGLLGIGTPVQCQTAEPLSLELTTHLTFEELSELGPHFAGEVTIPEIHCEGLEGVLVGPLLTAVMSGPENPYAFYIAPREPAVPSGEDEPVSSLTQVSAVLHARIDPNGEELTSCRFEYGPTTEYGSSVPCSPEPSTIKKIFATNFVSAGASGLAEGALYHYRVAMTNGIGTGYTPDATFSTPSAASAPQYGQCVAQKGGEYSDEGCSTLATKHGVPDHKGHYEWVPGPAPTCVAKKKGEYTDAACTSKAPKAHKGSYEREPGAGYTSSGGPVSLETAGLSSTVKCSAVSGAGQVTGTSTGTLRLTLSGCEAGGKKCTSEGADSTPSGTAGAIETNLLDTRLLGTASEAFTQLTSGEHTPYLAEYSCEGVHYRVAGALAGAQKGDFDAMSTTSTTAFAFLEGEQALTTEQQSGEGWTGPDPTVLTGTLTNTAASATEVR